MVIGDLNQQERYGKWIPKELVVYRADTSSGTSTSNIPFELRNTARIPV